MASLKRNIIANFLGRIWGNVIGILFVPVYIHFIGVEAYGLIGFFTTIQVILGLLDMGLSTTLNREIARHNMIDGDKQYIGNLVFTMERIYLLVALMIGIVLTVASSFFAWHWVNAEKLGQQTVVNAFILIAVNFALQFPGSLYQGGLMGLQKQVSLNVILSIIITVKALGSILVLWLVSPTIIAFLIWQVLLSIVQLFFLRKFLWKNVPPSPQRPYFDKSSLRKSGRYAAGIMSISALVIVLTQSDKIILSKLITLTEFGYYTLAGTIATILATALFPVTNAIFPRITELVNKQRQAEVIQLFHSSSQLVSFIIMPVSLSIFIFSYDIILAWTRNIEIAANAGPILKYLVLGSMISGLLTVPYQYTLSIGWLRYGINITICAIIVFLPFIFFAANRYGAVGAAFIWMVLNVVYLIFAMLYLFSKHLREEKLRWYLRDIGRPFLVCGLSAAPFFLIRQYYSLSNFSYLLLLAGCLIVCYATMLWFGTPSLKKTILSWVGVAGKG